MRKNCFYVLILQAQCLFYFVFTLEYYKNINITLSEQSNQSQSRVVQVSNYTFIERSIYYERNLMIVFCIDWSMYW